MSLPLRDAREVFEREYLFAQINRFGGNISRTAEFVGMERSALHRKLKALGMDVERAGTGWKRMSRIAYVNGRYLPHARRHGPCRGPRLSIRRRRLRSLRGEGGALDRRARAISTGSTLAGRTAHRMADEAARRCGVVLREVVARNRIRYGIVYLQITRGVARRDHGFPAQRRQAEPRRHRARARSGAQRRARGDGGIAVITVPDDRWAPRDIKTIATVAQCAGASRPRASRAPARPGSSTRDGFVTEGASTNAWIVDAPATVVTRQADHAILRGVTRAALIDVSAALGLDVRRTRRLRVEEALCARAKPSSSAPPDRDAGRVASTAVRSATEARVAVTRRFGGLPRARRALLKAIMTMALAGLSVTELDDLRFMRAWHGVATKRRDMGINNNAGQRGRGTEKKKRCRQRRRKTCKTRFSIMSAKPKPRSRFFWSMA